MCTKQCNSVYNFICDAAGEGPPSSELATCMFLVSCNFSVEIIENSMLQALCFLLLCS